jgi:hypothetical protein
MAQSKKAPEGAWRFRVLTSGIVEPLRGPGRLLGVPDSSRIDARLKQEFAPGVKAARVRDGSRPLLEAGSLAQGIVDAALPAWSGGPVVVEDIGAEADRNRRLGDFRHGPAGSALY